MKYLTLALLFLSAALNAAAQLAGPLEQGNKYYRESQFDLAERQYRAALAKDTASYILQYNLANALYRQRKFGEAASVLQKTREGMENGEPKGRSYYNEGVIYSKQKDLEKSIDAYKHALRNNPSDKEARENLQKAMGELKRQQKEKQNQQQQQKPSKMSSPDAQRQLERLQQKEQEIQKRLQKKGQGSSMPKDW
jgi:Ca-activated chloride channel family protein